jgi:hypothetical protein
MPPTTKAEVSEALRGNADAPYGPVRSAYAERLVQAAEQTGDRPLTVQALQELISAYEFGGEAPRMLVPFARVLRMWDDDPADFDRWAIHRLHWHFKWVTSGMISHPSVPLSTMHKWLAEMEQRYRQRGYGRQTVQAQRHFVASHVGDNATAQEAFEAWLAADRDEMSDCQACEHKGQGDWRVDTGRDDDAIALWQPVLDGELRCEEEPHRTLAASLLPLARLGRLDQARANHLRGYRMVRGKPNLRRSVGQHIEFAALTGNEARGLEILGQHLGWLADEGESALTRLAFLVAVAVLLRRLSALGHADLEIAGTDGGLTAGRLLAQVEREVTELARTFDERNGSTEVTANAVARMSRAPLVESLTLGARSTPLATVHNRVTEAASTVDIDVATLVAEAEALTEAFNPAADSAWARVAATGADLDPAVELRVAEARAVAGADDPAASRTAFAELAHRYAELPDPARIVLNQGRAALAAAEAGDPAAEAENAAVLTQARALRADGGLRDRDFLLILLYQARAALCHWLADQQPPHLDGPGYGRLAAALDELDQAAVTLAAPYFTASVALLRGQILDLAHDAEAGAAVALLQQSADGFLAAGAPWRAAFPLIVLSRHARAGGDLALAEEQARAALRHGGNSIEPALSASVTVMIAECCWAVGGRDDEVVDLALVGADRFDQAGERHSVAAAQARVLAGFAFQRAGRPAEAVALFEIAMPALDGYPDEEYLVRAKHAFFRGLRDVGERREAAQTLLSAAAIASGWPDQNAHASLAHEAGGALEAAGLAEEAGRAYEQAAKLWHDLDQPGQQIRATRGAAWTRLRRDEPDWPGALELFAAAREVAESAAARGDDPELRYDLAETDHQLAQALWNRTRSPEYPTELAERGLAAAESAAAGFAEIAAGFAKAGVAEAGVSEPVADALFIAAQLEHLLGRTEAARTRLLALRALAEQDQDSTVIDRCDELLADITPD